MWHVEQRSVAAFDFGGLRIRDLTPGALKSGSVAEIEVPPGARHQPARSTRSDKFYLCLEGAVSFRVDGKDVSLRPGNLLIIERKEWFSYAHQEGSPARLLLIHVPPFDLDCEEFRDEEP